MKFLFYTSAVVSCVALMGCATLVDGASQEVKFDVKGASTSVCEISNNEFAYTVRPPQTIWVRRGQDDLNVICQAPGNREVKFVMPSTTNGMIAGNIITAIVPGVAYDIISGGAYEYPASVTVDFSSAPIVPFSKPLYHADDTLYPDGRVGIEDMGPETPELSGDAEALDRRRAAQDEYQKQKDFDAERTERMLEFDPGMKK